MTSASPVPRTVGMRRTATWSWKLSPRRTVISMRTRKRSRRGPRSNGEGDADVQADSFRSPGSDVCDARRLYERHFGPRALRRGREGKAPRLHRTVAASATVRNLYLPGTRIAFAVRSGIAAGCRPCDAAAERLRHPAGFQPQSRVPGN